MFKNHFYSIIIILAIFACDQKPEVGELSQLEIFADSLFQTSVDSSFIAGASVVVYQKGEKLLDKSYGYASLELSVTMPENPSFEIGSVTKQFTSAAILKLVEQDKLALDDDFTKYLEYDTKGRIITINHLLNHTSGIASYTEIPDFWNLSLHQFERDTLVRLVEKNDFLFEPGEALIYNNSAYFFLGLIIEKASGMSYEEYLDEQIFAPLGMNNTYYCSTSDIIRSKVYGYSYSPDGLKQKPYLDHTWPYAAGSLCSTTEDLFIWMEALHTGKIFNDEFYSKLITPGSLKDGSKLRYAMGLTNFMNFGNQTIAHGGVIHGFLSDTRYFPEADLYIICLVNTIGPKGAGFFANELTWKLLDKQEVERKEIDIDVASLEGEYSGQASGRVLSIKVSTLSDGLILSTQGSSKPDTLNTYVGNMSWVYGNQRIIFKDEELRLDNPGGYYILKRQ